MLGRAAEALGRAVLELDTDDAKLHQGIQRAKREAIHLGANFAKVGAGMTALVSGPIALFGSSTLSAFLEARKAGAAVDAALKSMGETAGFTGAQLRQMASDLQASTTFDDDAILGRVTANLLTFGNIQGEVFRRAQQSALDLSARLGTDLQSSAIMLGKALNDPVIGVTALTRVGVSLSEQQKVLIKDMAKAGDVAGAQAIILAELEKQYGGQARALAEADGGVAQLTNQWGNLKEQIGEIVAVVLPPLIATAREIVGWLQTLDRDTLKWIVTIAGIAAAVGPALITLGALVAGIGALLPVLSVVGTAIMGLIAATGPIGLFIAAAGLLYLAWSKWGADVQLLFTDTFEWIALTVGEIQTFLTTAFTAITDTITAPFRKMVEAAQWAYDVLVGNSIVPDMVVGIEGWLRRLASTTGSTMGSMTKTISGATQQQLVASGDAWGQIFSMFGAFSADMLRVSQIYSAGQAFISTMAGAAEALKLPFPANLAAAAQVIGTGLGFVAAIKGTSAAAPSASFASPSVAGGGVGSTQVADAPTLAAAPQQRLPQEVTVNVSGSRIRKADREEVEAIFEGLQEFFDEGARFKVNWDVT